MSTKDLLAEELRAAITELPWTWLDYLEVENVVSRVGVAGIRCVWLTDGTVRLEDTYTRETLGTFRVAVTVEEVSA